MNEPVIFTATTAAWMFKGTGIQDMTAAIDKGDTLRAINALVFWGKPSQEKFGDYIRVGEADITVRLLPREEQTRMALTALNAQLSELRAAYLTRQQEIMEEISHLQALPNEVEA